MNEICNHGRVAGHTCLDCPDGVASEGEWLDCSKDYTIRVRDNPAGQVVGDWKPLSSLNEVEICERQPTGLDAPYYDLPENIHSAQDLIEYLDLNFANGNILKSLVRQYGSATKNTEEIYEAEKRYFFAERELRRVQKAKEVRRRLPNVPEGEETP